MQLLEANHRVGKRGWNPVYKEKVWSLIKLWMFIYLKEEKQSMLVGRCHGEGMYKFYFLNETGSKVMKKTVEIEGRGTLEAWEAGQRWNSYLGKEHSDWTGKLWSMQMPHQQHKDLLLGIYIPMIEKINKQIISLMSDKLYEENYVMVMHNKGRMPLVGTRPLD